MSTANDATIVEYTLTEPSSGNWALDVSVDVEELDGDVDLLLSDVTMNGHVRHGTFDGGLWRGRIIGGYGGLDSDVQSRYYVSEILGTVLAEIAEDSGERLSGEIAPSVLRTALPAWARPNAKASRAIDDLAAVAGLNWRVLRDGTIWIGEESYPETDAEYVKISQGAADVVTIAPTSLAVAPGDLFEGRRVADVITVSTKTMFRQSLWLLQDDATARILRVFRSMFDRFVGRRLDYSAAYPARVVNQSGDDTLEVIIDDERMRGEGIKRVPIRLGIPGARCEVANNARVRVMFDEQDPSKPFAALWDTNPSDVQLIEIGSGAQYLSRDDKVQQQLNAIKSAISGATVVANDGGASLKSTILSSLSNFPGDTACETIKAR